LRERKRQRIFWEKPFPDFTVTDSEGKTFTLSEALKDHEAVLIN
jgi:peroxiredoxin